MTLVELLVVLSIVLMVAAATIPRLRPGIDRSRVREAARSIQLYLSTARNLAMSSGRNCGVMLERLPSENGCAMSLTQVVSPPLYGGDYSNSVVQVTPHQISGTNLPPGLMQMPATSPPYPPNTQNPDLIYAVADVQFDVWPSVPLYPGDQIQLNYQGLRLIVAPAGLNSVQMNLLNPATSQVLPRGNNTLVAYVDQSHGEQCAFLTQKVLSSYTIIRWPTKSLASALQLPSPACIDLMWSGIDPVATTDVPAWTPPTTPSTATPPVMIMFGPNGAVDSVYVTSPTGAYSAARVTSSIYLLVGRRDEVIDPPNASSTTTTNLNDFTNLWVGINGNTGLIVVTDLAASGTNVPVPTAANYFPSSSLPLGSVLYQSRSFARLSAANGGK